MGNYFKIYILFLIMYSTMNLVYAQYDIFSTPLIKTNLIKSISARIEKDGFLGNTEMVAEEWEFDTVGRVTSYIWKWQLAKERPDCRLYYGTKRIKIEYSKMNIQTFKFDTNRIAIDYICRSDRKTSDSSCLDYKNGLLVTARYFASKNKKELYTAKYFYESELLHKVVYKHSIYPEIETIVFYDYEYFSGHNK